MPTSCEHFVKIGSFAEVTFTLPTYGENFIKIGPSVFDIRWGTHRQTFVRKRNNVATEWHRCTSVYTGSLAGKFVFIWTLFGADSLSLATVGRHLLTVVPYERWIEASGLSIFSHL